MITGAHRLYIHAGIQNRVDINEIFVGSRLGLESVTLTYRDIFLLVDFTGHRCRTRVVAESVAATATREHILLRGHDISSSGTVHRRPKIVVHEGEMVAI